MPDSSGNFKGISLAGITLPWDKAEKESCPTCGSPDPDKHPVLFLDVPQYGTSCDDDFHDPPSNV